MGRERTFDKASGGGEVYRFILLHASTRCLHQPLKTRAVRQKGDDCFDCFATEEEDVEGNAMTRRPMHKEDASR